MMSSAGSCNSITPCWPTTHSQHSDGSGLWCLLLPCVLRSHPTLLLTCALRCCHASHLSPQAEWCKGLCVWWWARRLHVLSSTLLHVVPHSSFFVFSSSSLLFVCIPLCPPPTNSLSTPSCHTLLSSPYPHPMCPSPPYQHVVVRGGEHNAHCE